LKNTKDNTNNEIKIIELIGKRLEVKLSKKIPPITQYHKLGIKPKLSENNKT
jgi:hypothetical protein